MSRPKYNLVGQKFGRLTVISQADDGRPSGGWDVSKWVCLCECGTRCVVYSANLLSNRTRSCGCLMRENILSLAKNRTRHGECSQKKGRSPEYRTWSHIKTRCYNSKCKSYGRYGGRGITVCDRWLASYEDFLADMGRRPTPRHTIDRRDNNRGYSPDNCKWSTWTEQARNKRNTVMVAHGGETKSVHEWAAALGTSSGVLRNRIYKGWSIERVLTTPVHNRGRRPRSRA